ncbi:hypothetical protein [Nostoc sp.]|uniref:hypothetical protein n=1 Tax=Nostoc sp. TaxID=1180 RepID=UPI002FFB1601
MNRRLYKCFVAHSELYCCIMSRFRSKQMSLLPITTPLQTDTTTAIKIKIS